MNLENLTKRVTQELDKALSDLPVGEKGGDFGYRPAGDA